MNSIEKIVETASARGAAQVLEMLGISAGEISQNKARAIYGKWFIDAERAGRIHPARIGEGKNGTHYYRVIDILRVKMADLTKAELQIKTL